MTATTALTVKASALRSSVRTNTSDPITTVEYSGLQAAFYYLNANLFDGELPNVFITYQRRAHSGGYFAPDRFTSRDGHHGAYHEIALNPDGFVGREDEYIVSILLHEMAHLWQQMSGKPSPRGYHNKQWAAKMESLGLMPSNSGMVGGKRTGARMSHYVIPDGAYATAFAALAASGWKLTLQSAIAAGGTKAPSSKVKFTCQGCGANAWGRPDSELVCKDCLINHLPDLHWLDRGKAKDLLEAIGRATMLPPRPEPDIAAASNGELAR